MSDITSANTSENNAISEAQDDSSAKEPETAEQAEGTEPSETVETESEAQDDNTVEDTDRDYEKDAAYAEMRRRTEEAEARAAELEYQQRLADNESNKATRLAEVERLARQEGLSDEEIEQLKNEAAAEADKDFELSNKESEIEQLQQMNAELQGERQMQEDLIAIQQLDPEVKDLDDLGEAFYKLRLARDEDGENYISAEEAYFAARAIQEMHAELEPKAPQAPGIAATSAGEQEFYTKEQVEHMSADEIRRNLDKINRSMQRPNWGD